MKNEIISYGSVCSGIEAASVAWHPLGWRPAWFAEIEGFPSAVLAHRFPGIVNLGDMTGIAAGIRDGTIEAPDVLAGGTPCQAFSVAGARAGLADPRGQLTLSYVDLANAIDTNRSIRGLQPVVTLWENVPGVLSSRDNAFGCFLGALAGEDCELEPAPRPASGKSSRGWRWDKVSGKHVPSWPDAGCVYGPERTIAWRVIDAQYVGLAQRRRRVFVVASAREGFDPAAILFEFDGLRRDSPPVREAGKGVTGTLSSRTSGGGGLGTDFECSGGLVPESAVTCLAHGQGGAEIAIDRSPTLTCNHEQPIVSYAIQAGALRINPLSGPDGVGVQAEHAYTLEARAEVQCVASIYAFQPRIGRNGRGDTGDIVNALTAQAGETGKGDAAPCVAIAFDARQECVSNEHVFGALGSSSPQAQAIAFSCKDYGADVAVPLSYGIRTANTSSNGWGIQEEITHTLDRGMGVAVACPMNADDQIVKCVTGDITHTLKAEGFDGSEDGTGRGQPIVAATAWSVRRIMPIEAERLQGFPDNWTLIPWRKKMAADGPRYKALGNSMAVPCMAWIGRRLAEALS